jgi:FKBP-type peptidyl-prolyl cis-trans isomerase FkpA
MTEITRVPLQPIAKGALAKLWMGVAAVALAAGGLAWATLPPSVKVETLKAGSGEAPTMEDVVLINYKGMLKDGKVFDQGQQVPNPVSDFVPGFTKALLKMQKGGKYKIEIPAELGYGDKAQGPIPANSDLTFEVELLDFKNRAEIEAQMRAMQQLQAMQQGQKDGEKGMPPLPPGVPAPTAQ